MKMRDELIPFESASMPLVDFGVLNDNLMKSIFLTSKEFSCDLEKSSALSSFGRRKSSSYKDFVKEIKILTSKESLIKIFIL
jgi:hypothetical protein